MRLLLLLIVAGVFTVNGYLIGRESVPGMSEEVCPTNEAAGGVQPSVLQRRAYLGELPVGAGEGHTNAQTQEAVWTRR